MKREESFVTNLAKLYIALILSRGSAHGYAIMDEFKEVTGKQLSCGQVYPLLSDMEKKGLVEWKEEASGKRKRKVYSLTEKGRQFADGLKQKIMKLLGLQ